MHVNSQLLRLFANNYKNFEQALSIKHYIYLYIEKDCGPAQCRLTFFALSH